MGIVVLLLLWGRFGPLVIVPIVLFAVASVTVWRMQIAGAVLGVLVCIGVFLWSFVMVTVNRIPDDPARNLLLMSLFVTALLVTFFRTSIRGIKAYRQMTQAGGA